MTITGPALLRLCCAALLGAFLARAPAARADEAPLRTPHGLLEARDSESEEECGPDEQHPCEVIVVAGKVLFASRLASIEAALPSREAPQLVAVHLHDGGNALPGTDILLDFTGPRLLVVEGFGLADAEARADGTYLLRKVAGENELGDQVLGIHEYRPGSGRPVLLRKIVEHPVATIDEDAYPHAILADLDLRKPLVEAVGVGMFATLRRDMEVQEPLRVLADRFLVGSGCRAHDCPFAGGMFVIDRQAMRAIVLHFDKEPPSDGKVRYWGSIDAIGPVQLAAIREWLDELGLDLSDAVPGTDQPASRP
ncbi:MAG: hypothetical protein ACKOGH_01060 [Alphaproteobacteria bacterium]